MRRLLPLLLVVLAACSGKQAAAPRPTTSTSTSTSTTTTTAPPPPTSVPLPPAPAVPAKAAVLVANSGVVLPVEAQAAGGWLVQTPCGNTAVATGRPVDGATVVLDAGHGGNETGATGPNGLTEKALNLAVTGYARDALEKAGVAVVLTRTADYRVTLDTRAMIATRLRPRAFVSVHHNASPDGPRNGPGTETYYQIASPDSKRLAGLIYEEVVRALSAYQVPWVADRDAGAKYRLNSRGQDYYGIMRRAEGVPTALAELAYLSDPPEAALVARPDVQQAEGDAVARGIVRFLTTKDPGSGFVTPYPRTEPAGPGGGAQGCVDPPLA